MLVKGFFHGDERKRGGGACISHPSGLFFFFFGIYFSLYLISNTCYRFFLVYMLYVSLCFVPLVFLGFVSVILKAY